MSEDGDWLESLTEYRAIRGVYGDDGSRVGSLHLTRSRHHCHATIGIILRDFPSDPPLKYIGSDVVAVGLRFDAVCRLRMSGILDEEPGALSLTNPDENSCRFTLANEHAQLEIVAEQATVAGITSFLYEPPEFGASRGC